MGESHRQGVAKEFDCRGSIEKLITWGAKSPQPAPAPPVNPKPPPLPGPPAPKPKLFPSPTPPVTPKPTPGHLLHIVKPGDNLSAIARKYYGNSNDWPKIYQANKALIGPNPNLIQPGQHLIIP
ncbi:MAG: LysM peptidoglycan-binding domain-containing protein [Planctomycetes bacterium]|nr:LysM peptidoglycan-binding domain-containing protein [Planctomycetota bacterium]